ncbi:hypothetical protein VHARVF571_90145 [Vibrio harveyi]|nr:hypothetical protein VHARVF571_90145 [Vibrio harveyi]
MQRAFINWMKDCHEITEGEVIAIDGKTVRGSYNKSEERSAIHMVNALQRRKVFVLSNLKLIAKQMKSQRSLSCWSCKIYLVA